MVIMHTSERRGRNPSQEKINQATVHELVLSAGFTREHSTPSTDGVVGEPNASEFRPTSIGPLLTEHLSRSKPRSPARQAATTRIRDSARMLHGAAMPRNPEFILICWAESIVLCQRSLQDLN